MNTHPRIGKSLSALAITGMLGSCIVPGFDDRGRHESYNPPFRVYQSLPTSFYGSAYYHDGRYYTGGQHQTGSYIHQGRQYTSRYRYNKSFLYGGRLLNRRQQWDRPDRRHDTYPSRSASLQ